MASKKSGLSLAVVVFGVVVTVMSTGPVMAIAQDSSAESFPGNASISENTLVGDEVEALAETEEALELDPLRFYGVGLSFEQEYFLRMLRNAMSKRKSHKEEDRDVFVCWMERATKAHFRYLKCGRNGDWWANLPFGVIKPPTLPGYGTILRSQYPVIEGRLKIIFRQLAGPEDLDEEFIAMAMQGRKPPRDIPTEEELASFVEAYKVVSILQESDGSEQSQLSVIESRGLTLDRYNRIAELTQTYRTIGSEVVALME